MFNLFQKPKAAPAVHVTARLNMKLQPINRGEIFEDTLQKFLEEKGFGEVTGGGTQMTADGEIEYCDIEIDVPETSEEVVSFLVEALTAIGATKGSKLIFGDEPVEIPFGQQEAVALYLNGTDLPDEVYAECDVNIVFDELEKALGEDGFIRNNWQGPTETALYMYGHSFDVMKSKIDPFVSQYPLCRQCRIERQA
jgi:hypothetical protein